MRVYAKEKISIEELWTRHDTTGVFADIKALYRYHRDLVSRIDDIIRELSKGIITASGSMMMPYMNPGEKSDTHKLRILFVLLDTLIDILHRQNSIGIILSSERHSFMHAYIFMKSNIILLNSS
jgi:hypothetical protein